MKHLFLVTLVFAFTNAFAQPKSEANNPLRLLGQARLNNEIGSKSFVSLEKTMAKAGYDSKTIRLTSYEQQNPKKPTIPGNKSYTFEIIEEFQADNGSSVELFISGVDFRSLEMPATQKTIVTFVSVNSAK
jgi:hypothetical protein